MLKESFIRLIKEVKIPCKPLQTLIDKYASGINIDFLNVDVEGMSMEILRSIDWEKTQPKVICIEDDYFDFKNKENFGSEIFSFLIERSYELYAKTGLSCIYRMKEKN